MEVRAKSAMVVVGVGVGGSGESGYLGYVDAGGQQGPATVGLVGWTIGRLSAGYVAPATTLQPSQ